MTSITGFLEFEPTCPHCNKILDGFTGVDADRAPQRGDISICAYCQTVLEFGESELKFATAEALDETDLVALQRGHRMVLLMELFN